VSSSDSTAEGRPITTVGVVGCGAVSDDYLAGLADADSVRLVALADRDRDRAARAAATHRPDADDGPAVFADAGAMCETATPELVVNLTSHAAHAPVTRTCLRAGAHVYSEKPLAMNADAAADLLAVARDRDRRLGCAPLSHVAPTVRRLRRLLGEGRLGRVRAATAVANVGRVTEWHDDPESFLRAGPLRDGAVYPLTALVALFGRVERVRTADVSQLVAVHEVDGREVTVEAPDHAVATLSFADGPLVQLTASGYVPYQSREFVSLELHGDDASLYAADAGGFDRGGRDRVRLARLGREYGPVPVQTDGGAVGPADGPIELAAAARAGRPSPVDAGLAAHVVAVVDAIERAGETGGSAEVPAVGAPLEPKDTGSGARTPGLASADGDGLTTAPWPTRTVPTAAPDAAALPPIGFGCSRYRGDGEYVDLADPIEWAIDAGYRLFDAAELYGVEGTLGGALARPGSPDREALTLVSKVWNTNHDPARVRAACEGSLDRLGVDRLDAYLLHWPDAWQHQGPLEGVAELSHEELEALAFPTDGAGDPLEADVSLAETWTAMEELVADGLVDALGVCNVDRAGLSDLLADATVPPAIVQVERHPYSPREALVAWCHERGIRVQAHSPLSAPGLLDEPTLVDIAADRGTTPAQVVLRWNVDRGVVPLPSTTDRDHLLDNLDVFGQPLSAAQRARIDDLRDPDFSR
jgi:alcohol dehydrogenase (NADP+)